MQTIDQMAEQFRRMTPAERHAAEQAIARDLKQCDLGLVLATGKLRRQYERQRKLCVDAIKAMNLADGCHVSAEQLAADLADLAD